MIAVQDTPVSWRNDPGPDASQLLPGQRQPAFSKLALSEGSEEVGSQLLEGRHNFLADASDGDHCLSSWFQ